MQVQKNPFASRRWLCAGSVAALVVGAGPAFAGSPGDSLTWRLIVTGSQAATVRAVRTTQDPNSVQPFVLSETRPEAGGIDQESARNRPALPDVGRPFEEVPGDVGIQRADQRTADTLRPTDVEPGSPGGMAAASRTPAVMRGLTARSGGTAEQPAADRSSQEPALSEPHVIRPTETTAGNTGLDAARERPAIPDALRPVETTPGDVGMQRADQRTADTLRPTDTLPGNPDTQPAAYRPSPQALPVLADIQRWTALEAFEHEGRDMVAFNVGNRLSVAGAANPTTPLAWLDLSGFVFDIEVVTIDAMRYALVALGSEGLAVVDINDPARPKLLAGMQPAYLPRDISFFAVHGSALPSDLSASIYSIVTDGTTLWLHDWNYGLHRTSVENLLGEVAPG